MPSDYRENLERIFSEALRAADPYLATSRRLSSLRDVLEQTRGKLNILGFGKASARMAQAAEEILLNFISSSIVITKYGHALPLKKTEVIEAGHPIPDMNGLK